jgi:hypothetical protein
MRFASRSSVNGDRPAASVGCREPDRFALERCDGHRSGDLHRCQPTKVSNMKIKNGLLAAALTCALVSACSSPGTKVATTSETYRSMAGGQKTWCEMFGGCTCFLDGIQTTCSLVFACLNSGNCTLAK